MSNGQAAVLINTTDGNLSVVKGGRVYTLTPGPNGQFGPALVPYALRQFPGRVVTESVARAHERPARVVTRTPPTLSRRERIARLQAFQLRRAGTPVRLIQPRPAPPRVPDLSRSERIARAVAALTRQP